MEGYDLLPMERAAACLARTLLSAGFPAYMRRHLRHVEVAIGRGGDHVDLYPSGRVVLHLRDPAAASVVTSWAATR